MQKRRKGEQQEKRIKSISKTKCSGSVNAAPDLTPNGAKEGNSFHFALSFTRLILQMNLAVSCKNQLLSFPFHFVSLFFYMNRRNQKPSVDTIGKQCAATTAVPATDKYLRASSVQNELPFLFPLPFSPFSFSCFIPSVFFFISFLSSPYFIPSF